MKLTSLALIATMTSCAPAYAEFTTKPIMSACTNDVNDIEDEFGAVVEVITHEINDHGFAIVNIATIEYELYGMVAPDGNICLFWAQKIDGA